MPFLFPATLLIVAILSLTGCSDEPPANNPTQLSGKLIVSGSSTIAPLAAELAKNFEKMHPGVKVDVQTGGSSRGLADVRRKVSHIGMVSRKLKTAESHIQGHLLARDGVGIIIHKDNPIQSLTSEQIKAIHLGQLDNWRALGGADEKITVINKAEGRSTLEVFLKFFALDNRHIKPDIIIGDNEQGIKLVSKNLYAIAYVSIGTAEYSQHLGVPIKLIALDGIAATTANVVNNTFPLNRELNFVTQGEISPLGQTFLDYVLSPAAHDTIKEFGFVPITAR